jgi:hypothetical protein
MQLTKQKQTRRNRIKGGHKNLIDFPALHGVPGI